MDRTRKTTKYIIELHVHIADYLLLQRVKPFTIDVMFMFFQWGFDWNVASIDGTQNTRKCPFFFKSLFYMNCSLPWRKLDLPTRKIIGNRCTNAAINAKYTRLCYVKSIGHWSQAFRVPTYPILAFVSQWLVSPPFLCPCGRPRQVANRRFKQLTVALDIRIRTSDIQNMIPPTCPTNSGFVREVARTSLPKLSRSLRVKQVLAT